MALAFLKDRNENATLGNLGAFSRSGSGGHHIQAALAVYRQDQKSHHEQSIASDLTRGLLRKIFRETVLESSKQVKRKYSYSAVGSHIMAEEDEKNIGIMSKLKKLQKERLIVARLGFPDQAMEIDRAIEKIRDDLRKEREREDAKIMGLALEKLAVEHRHKLTDLKVQLREDAKKKREAFKKERNILQKKQERQFEQLVDDAIKRAIGKSKSCSCSKKYLCHHNKTASFNTRRPKKEVIHFRKNAKRLRHGGKLDESAAWEEKAAELDAEHLDKWREKVAASLSASAWGAGSSALDQLASQHQREVKRLETEQANQWTLMLMRHHTLRRNCDNVIMVEQKKLRNTCKKEAEERHRRDMLDAQAAVEGGTSNRLNGRPASGGIKDKCGQRGKRDGGGTDHKGNVKGGGSWEHILEEALGNDGDDEEGTARTGVRPPERPRSAPPVRGKRPQVNAHSAQATAAVAAELARAGGGSHGKGKRDGDVDSAGGSSRDLEGFVELEEAFSYNEYPSSGSLEEPEWVHEPWCGTNSSCPPVFDDGARTVCRALTATDEEQLISEAELHDIVKEALRGKGERNNMEATAAYMRHASVGDDGHIMRDGSAEVERWRCWSDSPASQEELTGAAVSDENSADSIDSAECTHKRTTTLATVEDDREDRRLSSSLGMAFDSRLSLRRNEGSASPRGGAVGEGDLKRYDWDARMIPERPSLVATSRIPSGSRSAKIKAKNATGGSKSVCTTKKAVSWGINTEVPPEPNEDEVEHDYKADLVGEGSVGASIGPESELELRGSDQDETVDKIVEREEDDAAHTDGGRSNDVVAVDFLAPPGVGYHRNNCSGGVEEDRSCGGVPPITTEDSSERGIDVSGEKVVTMDSVVTPPSRFRTRGVQQRELSVLLHDDQMQPNGGTGGVKTMPSVDEVSEKHTAVVGTISVKTVPADFLEGVPDEKEQARHILEDILDRFCLIRALHGDWLSLLGHIVTEEECRHYLHRWSRARHCEAGVQLFVDTCSRADLARGVDGRVSWGSSRAAAVAVASPLILAPFAASREGRCMVRTITGRKALGGRTVAEEPALARSKRPWRTLFEGTLGSLPHGAILCLSGGNNGVQSLGVDRSKLTAVEEKGARAATGGGRVVWTNEGFESLAGVDAVDVVGQPLVSLFDFNLGGGEEFSRSLETGRKCSVWMSMAGQGQKPKDVLCLHQQVVVPPALSDEGLYSVLLFLDTASVVLEDPRVQEGGHTENGSDRKAHSMSPACVTGLVPQDEGDRNLRQQCCYELSQALSVLLGDQEDDGLVELRHDDGGLRKDRANITAPAIGTKGTGDTLPSPRWTLSVDAALEEQLKEVADEDGGKSKCNSSRGHERARASTNVNEMHSSAEYELDAESCATDVIDVNVKPSLLKERLISTSDRQPDITSPEVEVKEYSFGDDISSSTEPRHDLVASPEGSMVAAELDTWVRDSLHVDASDREKEGQPLNKVEYVRGNGDGRGGDVGDCNEVDDQYEEDFFSDDEKEKRFPTATTTYVILGSNGVYNQTIATDSDCVSPSLSAQQNHTCGAAAFAEEGQPDDDNREGSWSSRDLGENQ